MTKTIRTSLAAMVAWAFLGSMAWAQQQVTTDGHALDANPQVGSGGVNNQSLSNSVSGNEIVTGNVTSGFAFRGARVDGVDLGVGYTDPTAFRGLLPGMALDQFTANSTGVPTFSNPTLSTDTVIRGPQPFYPRATTVTPPTGYTLVPSGGGYVQAPLMAPNLADTRIGLPQQTAPLPKPDEVILPGQVDPTNATSLYSASPLYGVQAWQMPQSNGTASNTGPNAPGGSNTLGSTGAMNSAQRDNWTLSLAAQIRQQLNQANQVSQANPGQSGVNSASLNGGPLSSASSASANQPLAPVVDSGTSQVESPNMAATAGDVSTSQSIRQVLPPLPAAAEQSSQYAQLRREMDQYNNAHPRTDEEASQQFLQALQARRAVTGETGDLDGMSPLVPQTPPTPPAAPMGPDQGSSVGGTTSGGGAKPPAPVTVESLADGVKSEVLAGMLKDGEDLIQRQKYDQAIDVFDAAARAVPNNAMVLLGRVEAELGGSYYRQADMDLRYALGMDDAILLAQYDIRKHLGDERLNYITRELKQISSESPENATPLLLLAYISFSEGDASRAAQWLDAADRRSGGNDPLIRKLQSVWTPISTAPSPAGPNPAAPNPAGPSAAPTGPAPKPSGMSEPTTQPALNK